MPNMPWFRFYSETLNDRKIKRICSATCQPKALIVGVWATILALANDSPERGKLMISDGLWLTHAEIMEETGLDHQAYHDIMAGFEGLRMTTYDVDTGLSIANWEGRQFKSDHSSPRVAKHRADKKRQEDEQEEQEGNVSEQLQEQPDVVIDIESDTDTEQEKDTDSCADAPPKPLTGRNLVKADLQAHFCERAKMRPPATGTKNNRTVASVRWWTPLLAIGTLVDDDIAAGKALIDAAIAQMDKEGLTLSAPQSIVKVAESISGKLKRGVPLDGSPPSNSGDPPGYDGPDYNSQVVDGLY